MKKFWYGIVMTMVLALALVMTGCGAASDGDASASGSGSGDSPIEVGESGFTAYQIEDSWCVTYGVMLTNTDSDNGYCANCVCKAYDEDGNEVHMDEYYFYIRPGATICHAGSDVNGIWSEGKEPVRIEVSIENAEEATPFDDEEHLGDADVTITEPKATNDGWDDYMDFSVTNNADHEGQVRVNVIFYKDGAICGSTSGDGYGVQPGETTDLQALVPGERGNTLKYDEFKVFVE